MNTGQTTIAACEDRLLRAKEVMQILGVSRATAYRLMSDGTLPVVRFGASEHRNNQMLRVRESTLMAWMRQNESRPAGPRGPRVCATY